MRDAILTKATDFISMSRNVADFATLFEMVMSEVSAYGVQRASTVSLGSPGTPLSVDRVIGNSSAEWVEFYTLQGFIARDPVAKRAIESLVPFTWSEVEKELANDRSSQEVFGAAREFGIRGGLVVPVHSIDGSRCVVTFAGQNIADDTNSIGYLQLVATYFHIAAERLAATAPVVANNNPLTARQLECLKWVAAGKTDWEIGAILNISESTVNRHIERAKTALGVRSRMQAVLAILAPI